jgi:hypothetical protein
LISFTIELRTVCTLKVHLLQKVVLPSDLVEEWMSKFVESNEKAVFEVLAEGVRNQSIAI